MPEGATLTSEQLAVLASPTRSEVYVRLRALGQGSAREVGEALGRSPESVHYHLMALEKVGLIHAVMRRPTARKPETVFAPTAKRVILPDPRTSTEVARLNRKTVLAGMRGAMRGYAAASERGETDPSLFGLIAVQRLNMRLSPDDFKELNRRLKELSEWANERQAEEGIPLHWHSIIYPTD
ncbi:MAG: helix-turn-helix transcriptional regulator [Armatimonadetes bacterium]|nr:helix-turn-helix transcriptional regulator [Armatimonadota bacterium]